MFSTNSVVMALRRKLLEFRQGMIGKFGLTLVMTVVLFGPMAAHVEGQSRGEKEGGRDDCSKLMVRASCGSFQKLIDEFRIYKLDTTELGRWDRIVNEEAKSVGCTGHNLVWYINTFLREGGLHKYSSDDYIRVLENLRSECPDLRFPPGLKFQKELRWSLTIESGSSHEM